MTDRIDELERLAMKNEPIPEDASLIEIQLYGCLRNLHHAYRTKQIDREQAKREKDQIIEEYRREEVWFKCWKQAITIRNALSYKLTEATKSDCPRCRDLVAIFEGRNPDDKTGTVRDRKAEIVKLKFDQP